MPVSLPQHDPNPTRRADALARTRALYRYDASSVIGRPVLAAVPARERFGPEVLTTMARVQAELTTNRATARYRRARRAARERLQGWLGPRMLHGFTPTRGPATPRHRAATRLFSTIAATHPLGLDARGSAAQDRHFAWSRLAGMNPLMLRRVTTLPPWFPVSDGCYRAVLADGDTLPAAAAEGRLFLADWRALRGLPSGSERGRRKYVHTPVALFATRKPSGAAPGGAFVPVAIQCDAEPGPRAPILTPLDGARWRMARTVVQVADLNYHELVLHLGRCHFLLELFATATRRALAEQHPLSVLLAPHFRYTLAINDHAKRSLLVPGGEVDRLLGGTLDGSLALIRRSVDEFRLAEALFDADLARRGVDDVRGLPDYPWRDDGAPLWAAIRDWVRDYVTRYYPDERARDDDAELRAWLQDLREPEGAGLRGVGEVDSTAALTDLVAFIIFTASALHSVINYSQFALAGFMPAMPCAAFAPAPDGDTPNDLARWDAMLMPRELAELQFEFFYQQSRFRLNKLGEYPDEGFADDERIAAALLRFRLRLQSIETTIELRERARVHPFPWLRPSTLPASVHI